MRIPAYYNAKSGRYTTDVDWRYYCPSAAAHAQGQGSQWFLLVPLSLMLRALEGLPLLPKLLPFTLLLVIATSHFPVVLWTLLLLLIPALVLQVTSSKPDCWKTICVTDPVHSFIYTWHIHLFISTRGLLCTKYYHRPWEYSSEQSRNPCPHGGYFLVGEVDNKANKLLLWGISDDKCYEEK